MHTASTAWKLPGIFRFQTAMTSLPQSKGHSLPQKTTSFWLQTLVLVITGGVVYSNTLNGSFHFDDFTNIVNNPAIRDLSPGAGWFTFNPRRWVGFLTFALNYHFHGLDVAGYHLVNISIHILNGLLVWYFTGMLLRNSLRRENLSENTSNLIAFFTALLFLVHPLMTEAVTYIVQRFVLLSSFFYLMSLILFMQGMQHTNSGTRHLYLGGSLMSGILSFFSKETGFTLPLMWALIWFFFFRGTSPNPVRGRQAGYFLAVLLLITGILILIAIYSGDYFQPIPPREGRPYSITPLAYYCTELNVLVTYLRLTVMPVNQTFDYDYPVSQGITSITTITSLLILLLLIGFAIFLCRKHRMASFSILWFFITISPQAIVPRPNVIFEHRAYLSAMGLILCWVLLLFHLSRQIRSFRSSATASRYRWVSSANLVILILCVQAVIFSCFTWQRNKVWENEYTLWSDCLRKAPGSARSRVNLGVALHQRQEYHSAILHFNEALKIYPEYLQAYNNRGVSEMALRDFPAAIRDFTQALEYNPRYLEAWANRGLANRKTGRFEQAIGDFTSAIQLDSSRADLYLQRGITCQLAGMEDQAKTDLNIAAGLGSEEASVYLQQGSRQK